MNIFKETGELIAILAKSPYMAQKEEKLNSFIY
jgi:hypothetical protein